MGVFVYVGNLGREMSEDAVRDAFVAQGFEVESVAILRSPQNDRSRGFGFVAVATDEVAEAAIERMNGAEVGGRKLVVAHARAATPRPSFENYRPFGEGRRSSGGARRRR